MYERFWYGAGHSDRTISYSLAALNVELQNFAQAGIPPLEVLRIATEHSAAMAGAGSVLGSVLPGKLADIVLLDGSPWTTL